MNKFMLVVVCVASLLGCGSESVGISSNDIGGLSVAQRSDSPTSLVVSGLLMREGLGVHGHRLVTSRDSLQIVLSTGEPDSVNRAKFSFAIDVPDEVNSVTFGTDNKRVWQR